MTITSVGYAGTVGDEQWSEMIPRVGSTFYSVDDFASFRVSITAGTRTISVAPGGASAVGIYDTSNAAVTKSLSSVPSGTRWDLVVLRRTWATKVTSVEVIEGGSTMALPSFSSDPGTVHEQPIALVRVDTSTTVQQVVDLRCIGGDGGLTAYHDLARSYLTRVGTQVRIGNVLWTRVVNALESPTWVALDVTPDTGWVDITRNGGWVFGFAQARRIGSQVSLRISASRSGGWGRLNQLAIVGGAFFPDVDWYVSSSAAAGRAEFMITAASGEVLSTQAPGSTITDLSIHTTYTAPLPV